MIGAPSHKWEAYRWLQKGLDARRERGTYPLRYVTSEQQRRKTLFKPTRRADGDLADFPRCSLLRIDIDTPVARALKIGQIADGGMPLAYQNMH
jgi:hypothetical protein